MTYSDPMLTYSNPKITGSFSKDFGISIDCAEIVKIWKLVDDLLKRPNTKGVLGIHQLTNKIHWVKIWLLVEMDPFNSLGIRAF